MGTAWCPGLSSRRPPMLEAEEPVERWSDGEQEKPASGTPSKTPTKAGQATKPATGGRGRRPGNRSGKGRPGLRQCRGCRGYFDSSGMALNQNFCHQDKASLDNIWKLAKRQGKLDWFANAKADDTKVQQLLASYHEKHPPPKAGQKRARQGRGKSFCVLQYIEEISCKSAAIMDDDGEMMWFEEYVEFAKSPKGGFKTRAQCTAQWQAWIEQMNDPEQSKFLFWDYDGAGPGPEGKLQFRIKTKKRVCFRNELAKTKSMQIREQEVRNPEQAALDGMQRRIQLEHESIGRASSSFAHSDAMKGMLAAPDETFEGVFQGMHMDIQQVENLLPEDDAEPDPADPGAGEGDGDREDDDDGAGTSATGMSTSATDSKKARKGWFDREKVAQAFIRSARLKACQFHTSLTNLVGDMQTEIAAVHSLDETMQKDLAVELRICETRKKAVEAVLNEDGEPLKALIEAWQALAAASAEACAGTTAGRGALQARAAELLRSPPSQSFADLTTFAAYQAQIGVFESLSTREEMQEYTKTLANLKKPLMDIMVASKGAVQELKRAREALEKLRKGSQAKGGGRGKGKGKGAPASGSVPGSQIFEHIPRPGCGLEIPVKTVTDEGGHVSEFQVGEPFVIEINGELKESCEDAEVAAFVSQFVQMYNADAKRTSAEGRAIQRMVSSSSMFTKVKSAIESIFPSGGLADGQPDASLAALLGPKAYAFTADRLDVSSEREHMACVRLPRRGQSQVALMRFKDAVAFMRSQKVDGPLPMPRVCAYVTQLTPQLLEQFCQTARSWHATLTPKHALYLPANMLICERSGADGDAIGIKMNILAIDATAAAEMQEVVTDARARGKDCTLMSKVIEAITPDA